MQHIRKATPVDADTLHQLGVQVYHSTYTTILSQDQIDFMLGKSYSPKAIRQTMAKGQDFYLLLNEEQQPLGFIALQQKDETVLRIEKLYLLAGSQGQGLGKKLIDFATEKARERCCSLLELNVNRNNKAYRFYLKQGFVVAEEVDIPYYGYMLDDYLMQKSV